MQYPEKQLHTIGVTPVSNGIFNNAQMMFLKAFYRMHCRGFDIVLNPDIWGQNNARAASAKDRAHGFEVMMQDDDIDFIMPPWGGHLAVEMLNELDFTKVKPKWVCGYSDISTILLALTLKTGIATAHMANIVDLRGPSMDDVTAQWTKVLATPADGVITQESSRMYQLEWHHDEPTDVVFHLTERTRWHCIVDGEHKNRCTIKGRLLGGCIDVIRSLIGTPFGDVADFRRSFTDGEPLLWYIDTSELDTVDLKRALIQMYYAGWFDDISGLLFSRVGKPDIKEDYTYEDVYIEMNRLLDCPILYDLDFGHQPPQMTLINGAMAEVTYCDGKGTLTQQFI